MRTPNSLLVPLDFGLQTSASPGRLVRNLHLGPFLPVLCLRPRALDSPASPPLHSAFPLMLSFQAFVWKEV